VEWVREEFVRLESSVGEKNREPLERYQRIRGWDSLKPKQAAILRDLAAWRETEARRRNVPRGRVIRDEVLLQLARHPPKTVHELRGLRGLHGAEIDRNGDQLVAIVTAALALPPSSWPDVPRERKPEPESIGLVELLQAVLKACAAEAEIAPTLLATSADIQALVDSKEKKTTVDLPLLRGWRRQLVGNLLMQILEGQITVSVDPTKGILRISPSNAV
jgi:ribonuclease D